MILFSFVIERANKNKNKPGRIPREDEGHGEKKEIEIERTRVRGRILSDPPRRLRMKQADTTAHTSSGDTDSCLNARRHHLPHGEPRWAQPRPPIARE